MEFVQWMEKQDKVIKLLFALPFLDIVWAAYRLVKAILAKDNVNIVVAVVILCLAPYFWWLVDFIAIAVTGSILFVKD